MCVQPQRIQISQHTRDKLKNLPFDVTVKGHVELQVGPSVDERSYTRTCTRTYSFASCFNCA